MTADDQKGLKLLALDSDDLAVISAHMQDAVLTVSEMTYLPREKRFAMVANRFDWESAEKSASTTTGRRRGKPNFRRRTGVRFERVLGAKITGINLKDPKQTISVLSMTFTPAEAPEGFVTIQCAGEAAVRLHVECIEGELKDLGAAWRTRSKPQHPGQSEPETGKG